mgnify:CR=1 FL=1
MISENKEEDVYIKKLVANVHIGLLEKCFNKASKGMLFDTKAECQHYQARYGGTIYILQKQEETVKVKQLLNYGLDDGVVPLDPPEDDDVWHTSESHVFEFVGKPMYALVLKDQRQLKNGFRYIKELLLQSHNNKLEVAYDTLKQNNINAYSIKADCFTIKATHLQQAKEL